MTLIRYVGSYFFNLNIEINPSLFITNNNFDILIYDLTIKLIFFVINDILSKVNHIMPRILSTFKVKTDRGIATIWYSSFFKICNHLKNKVQ